jgi:hypothetical protein
LARREGATTDMVAGFPAPVLRELPDGVRLRFNDIGGWYRKTRVETTVRIARTSTSSKESRPVKCRSPIDPGFAEEIAAIPGGDRLRECI